MIGLVALEAEEEMSFSLTQVTDFHSPSLQEINV